MPAAPEAFLQTFQNLVLALNAGVQTLNSSLVLALQGYATGTWMPTLLFGGSGAGITYAAQNGSYTKIGREVVCRFQLTLAGLSGALGAATIGGLPFTPNSDPSDNGAGGLVVSYAGMLALGNAPLVEVRPGLLSVALVTPGASGTAALTNSNFTGTATLAGWFGFFV